MPAYLSVDDGARGDFYLPNTRTASELDSVARTTPSGGRRELLQARRFAAVRPRSRRRVFGKLQVIEHPVADPSERVVTSGNRACLPRFSEQCSDPSAVFSVDRRSGPECPDSVRIWLRMLLRVHYSTVVKACEGIIIQRNNRAGSLSWLSPK
jgi:hypothetical protein